MEEKSKANNISQKNVESESSSNTHPIHVFNSLTREFEQFIPTDGDNNVQMFVCGPTVYGEAHIGNGRTFTSFDFVARYLRYRGYNVDYIMNITDIDDKIIHKAQEEGTDWKTVAEKYDSIFREDMRSLGNTAVTEYIPATYHIDSIVNQVQVLLEKGIAYKLEDGIYFSVSSFEGYGELSGRTKLNEQAQSRVDENANKRDPRDFCLWKYSKPGEPVWDTAIGKGRPGWHIEDTAISIKRFGSQYTLHGGAIDLQHPHHDAEIAIAESVTGQHPFVKYWLHAGFLTTEDNEKMSKSRGSMLRIREALQEADGRLLRFWYLSGHYRKPLKYNAQSFSSARNSLLRIDNFVHSILSQESKVIPEESKLVEALRENIIGALDHDFNTPQAYAALFDYISDRNEDGLAGEETIKFFKEINDFLGIFSFQENNDEEIQKLVDERNKLRSNRMYKEADEIATKLREMGVVLKDHPDRTDWSKSL